MDEIYGECGLENVRHSADIILTNREKLIISESS